MRMPQTVLTALLLGALATSSSAYADAHHSPVATMANIMIGLEHFPSDADKAALAAIAEGEHSDSVKAVARAIANISHKVSVEDQTRLAEIAGDDDEPAALRELAAIVKGINHIPDANAVAALKVIARH